MATSWVNRGNLKGPKGDPGDPAPVTWGEGTVTTSGSSLTPDVATIEQLAVTLNHNITLNLPVNGADGQKVLLFLLANSANRNVTPSSSFVNMSGFTFPATVPTGRRLALGLARSSGVWYIMAARLQP